MSVAESGEAVVEVRISARPALIPTVRAVASDLAGRADFDLDAISDLRMAVDEACTTLIGVAAHQEAVLSCRFVLATDQIDVTVSIEVEQETTVNTDSFGWRVLETLADQVSTGRGSADASDDLFIRLTKHAGAVQ